MTGAVLREGTRGTLPHWDFLPLQVRVKNSLEALAQNLKRIPSMLPKNILVPTDLSAGAEEALDYGRTSPPRSIVAAWSGS
jgi:hypothetical protein